MKRPLFLGLLVLALVSTIAFAQQVTQVVSYLQGGVHIGSGTGNPGQRQHRITKSLTVDVDYDFASSTIVCSDTPAATATGVKKGDPCFVGIGPRDGGTQIVTANSVFTCFSDADNTVKLRHCAVGTAANPDDAGYVLRTFSSL